MLIAMIEGDNVRIHGRSQGFLGLPVNHMRQGDGTKIMQTAWTPTPTELETLNAGGNVLIEIKTSDEGLPPPMKVGVTGSPIADNPYMS